MTAAQAAIVFAAANFDLSGPIYGRHAASHGFLAGYLRHGGARAYRCAATSAAEIAAFRRFAADAAPGAGADGVLLSEIGTLAEIGTLLRPGPDIGQLAWLRRGAGQRTVSLVGVTHTLSELRAAEAIGGLLTAPVQAWDALICTSQASRAAVLRLLDDHADYLAGLFGAPVAPRLQLPVIPLGVDSQAFAPPDPAAVRARERARLALADDEVALLYVGRLDPLEKANPLPMYLAAARAAERTGRRLRLIECGWAPSAAVEAAFIEAAAAVAPGVPRQVLDGRRAESRAAWFAADIFLSCADNVQESFGLTPVEAMAAGLPAVVSDWDGYRDSVRDGLDGIRVPTSAPPPGLGEPLALLHAAACLGHDGFCGAASQATAVDVDALTSALVRLIEAPDLRRRMGETGRRRARETFDWRVIVGRYQDLWAELAERRRSAPEAAPLAPGRPPRPLAMDPYRQFDHFPSRILDADCVLALAPDAAGRAAELRRLAVAAPMPGLLLDGAAFDRLLDLAAGGPAPIGRLLAALPPADRHAGWLTLGWLAKMGLARWESGPGDSGLSPGDGPP